MEPKIVKFKNLDISKFSNFISSIDINKLPFAIEIRHDKVVSKVHPAEKNFLKYFATETSNIFGEINLTDEINYLRLNMITVKKLKEGIEIYSKSEVSTVDGEFEVSYDEANGKSWRINVMKLKSKHKNLKISGHEARKVPFLPDEIWNDKLFDISDYILKFDIDSEFIKSTLRMINFEKDASDKSTSVHKSILEYDGKTKKLCFRSKDDKWRIDYNPDNPDNPDEPSEYGEYDFKSDNDYLMAIQEIPFKLMTKQKYTAYYVSNKNMGARPINLMFFVNSENEVIMTALATVNR
jgi:hypothetical protein